MLENQGRDSAVLALSLLMLLLEALSQQLGIKLGLSVDLFLGCHYDSLLLISFPICPLHPIVGFIKAAPAFLVVTAEAALTGPPWKFM